MSFYRKVPEDVSVSVEDRVHTIEWPGLAPMRVRVTFDPDTTEAQDEVRAYNALLDSLDESGRDFPARIHADVNLPKDFTLDELCPDEPGQRISI